MERVRALELTQIWFELGFHPLNTVWIWACSTSYGPRFPHQRNFIKKMVIHTFIILWNLVWSGNKWKHEAATGATQTSGMRKQTNVTRAPQTWTEKLHVPLLAGWPWVTLVNLTVLFPLIMERWILPCRTDVRIRGTVCEAPSTVPGTWWVLNSGT